MPGSLLIVFAFSKFLDVFFNLAARIFYDFYRIFTRFFNRPSCLLELFLGDGIFYCLSRLFTCLLYFSSRFFCFIPDAVVLGHYASWAGQGYGDSDYYR